MLHKDVIRPERMQTFIGCIGFYHPIMLSLPLKIITSHCNFSLIRCQYTLKDKFKSVKEYCRITVQKNNYVAEIVK